MVVMVYLGLLYQDLIKRGDVLPKGKLPPVLPIVLYNGTPRWSAETDVFDLIPPVPGLVEQFKPRLRYLLIDENAYTDTELASLKNLVAAVFRVERPVSPAMISELIATLSEWLVDRPDLGRMFTTWIRATLSRRQEYRVVLPQVNDLQELNTMLSDRLEEWAKGYKAEGMQIGMLEGEAAIIKRQLIRRFGALPESFQARLKSGTSEQLETWAERLLEASTLADVFDNH